MSLNVGIIGARRRLQGTGPWMARAFKAAGCHVNAVVGTSDKTLTEAQDFIRHQFNLDCRGYLSIAEMLAGERKLNQDIDVVVICSPTQYHYGNVLEIVENAETLPHILCEKPLFWDEQISPEAQAEQLPQLEELLNKFVAAKRHVALNTQWPWTLPGFFGLYPEIKDSPITEFEMRLSPCREGPIMIIDSASHLLSILESLLGFGDIESLKIDLCREKGWQRVKVECDYVVSVNRCAVQFHLEVCPNPPRPAWYSLNGKRADRGIELPHYQQYLSSPTKSENNRVNLEDPLDARIKTFVSEVQQGETARVQELLCHQRNFLKLAAIARDADL